MGRELTAVNVMESILGLSFDCQCGSGRGAGVSGGSDCLTREVSLGPEDPPRACAQKASEPS